jgi:hypothetical protein
MQTVQSNGQGLLAFLTRPQAPVIPKPQPYTPFEQQTDAMAAEIGEPIHHENIIPIISNHYGLV